MKRKEYLLKMLVAVVMMAVVSAKAQTPPDDISVRNRLPMGCALKGAMTRADEFHPLSEPYDFDPQKTYRQPVVLVSFRDMDFSMDDPAAYYNRLFNEPGFNEGAGRGCVADYFREQSAGRLNLQFDIYGPVKVDESSKGMGYNYGDKAIRKAVNILCETEETDFAIYDWKDKGEVYQVVFVVAGYTGNQMSGYTWPNTSFLYTPLPGGITPRKYTLSCERWKDESLCGIGTIVHEFCHCLGLPDLYPMEPATAYSAVDEWDLMDGGNYTNRGWCPPNLTAMELMYLGWAAPEELTGPATIKDMKPLSDGGKTYIVRSTSNSNEYYLLENRRQEGWDYGCPGNGLLIYHVDFNQDDWLDNRVNASDSHYRYDLFHADGKDYITWNPANNDKDETRWTVDNHLRCIYLSTSPYPYTDPVSLVVNASLTDESSPAATLFTPAADGRDFMGKAITNIQMAADGTISFDFMGGEPAGIKEINRTPDGSHQPVSDRASWFSLDGRRLSSNPTARGIYVYEGRKVVIK